MLSVISILGLDQAEPYLAILGTALLVVVCSLLRHETLPELQIDDSEVAADPNRAPRDVINCYNPATRGLLGTVPALSKKEIHRKIAVARDAQQVWRHSSFRQRRLLLKILLKFVTQHQDEICRISARDSGKPILDAAFGELTVTCEKICWLLKEGERWLRPEHRTSSRMMFYKSARVEYHPIGVIGAIVPWNYPFHNLMNPLLSAVFAGNAIVIKASEHASWSATIYARAIEAAVAAAGAPRGLVHIVTGRAEAGAALVDGGVGKLIFVGSTAVGRRVMAAAAETLTPVVLELGGKDPIIICGDADIDHAVAVTMRGTFQSNGQNCAGCERVLIDARVYDECLGKLVAATRGLRQAAPLTADPTAIDAGALALPGLAENVHRLVADAVSQGAKVLVGGAVTHPGGAEGDFFAPTVLVGVTSSMRIWREEVFGPVMLVRRFRDDDEAVALANDCDFGLGSNIFSRSRRRANDIARRLEVGMTTINDFATTYMNQSLPFGGVKDSGFDRFAGVEGLRGACIAKAVCEDRFPWLLRTDIPRLLQYPTKPTAFQFQTGMIRLFYAPGLAAKLSGVVDVMKAILARNPSQVQR